MKISELYLHPVKGMRGHAVDDAFVASRGLAHDRRWIVSDGAGMFLSQRTCPDLARITARTADAGMVHLSLENGDSVLATANGAARRTVTVWKSEVMAADADAAANAWLSRALGRPALLHFMDDAAERLTVGEWAPAGPVSFADSFPVLITNTASLQALNAAIADHGGDAIPMTRFRPNIVIDGAAPWAEDEWKSLRIGDVMIDLVKPCDRCQVTTLDQATGESRGKEPLATLARLRRSAHPQISGVVFGVNSAVAQTGAIAKGQPVAVHARRSTPWPMRPIAE